MNRQQLWVVAAVAGMGIITAFATSTSAERKAAKHLVNVNAAGVALQGNCPVHLYERRQAVRGDAQFQTKYEGATYYFASAADQAKFDADPAKYVPQYGGYCAFGVGVGKLFDVDLATAVVVKGKLYLNLNRDIAKKFAADLPGNIAKAQAEWPALMAANAK